MAGKQSVVKLDLKQEKEQEQEPNRIENSFRNSIQNRHMAFGIKKQVKKY